MAAPQDAPEQGFRLRKFQGTQTEWDSTFIGPSFLVASENWIPAQSFRLGKRPGSTLIETLPTATGTNLLAAHDPNGVLYLYVFGTTTTPVQGLVYQLVEEGGFQQPATWIFTHNAPGRLIQFRNRIYAGNGIDPIKSWLIGDNFANVQTFGPLNDDGAPPAPTFNNDNNAVVWIPTGTYAYAWARFNTVTGLYTGRTHFDPTLVGVGSFTIPPQCTILTFPKPTLVPLAANEIWRLFISPRNFPVEYATMQMDQVTAALPSGMPATSVTLTSIQVTDTPVPMAVGANVFRTGSMFLIWENRLVFAGMQALPGGDSQAPYCVFATDTILPGGEQAAFNQGTLFPAFAKVPLPAKVTGIGVAGITSEYDPVAPLLFFTESKTFIVQGDPFDPNGAATLREVSSRVGCIGHDSIVSTPIGTIWCGIDSIYMMPPGGGFPVDIGWPIANMIRQIPTNLRPTIVATFHKQFYKLAIPALGDTANTTQWWLDLRDGLDATPSWWGPMTGFAVTALTGDPDSHFEVDRCYAAIQGATGAAIMRLHQLGTYTDQLPDLSSVMPIRSAILSGRFDADQPFLVKVFTRMRLISQTGGQTQLHVYLTTDGGVTWTVDPILLGVDMDLPGQFEHLVPAPPFPPPPSNPPANKRFATGPGQAYAKFATVSPAEAQTIMPYDRPRGLSVQVQIVHDPAADMAAFEAGDPTAPPPFFGLLELRDFELLFLFSGRKVRFLNERISK